MKNFNIVLILLMFSLTSFGQVKISQVQGLQEILEELDEGCCDSQMLLLESIDASNEEIVDCLKDGLVVTIEDQPISVDLDFGQLTDWLANNSLDANISFQELLDYLAANDLMVSFDSLLDFLGEGIDVNVDFADLVSSLSDNNAEVVDCLRDIKGLLSGPIPVDVTNENLNVTVDFETLTDFLEGGLEVTLTNEPLEIDWSKLLDFLGEGIDVNVTNDPLTISFDALTDWLDNNSLAVDVDFDDLISYLAKSQLGTSCEKPMFVKQCPGAPEVICETDIQTACDLDDENELIEGITRVIETCNDGTSTTTWFTSFGTNSQASYTPISGLFDCVTRAEIPEPEPPAPLCSDWEIIEVYQLVGTNGVNKRVHSVIFDQLNGDNTTAEDVFNQPVDITGMPGIDPALGTTSTTVVETDLLVLDFVNGRDAMQVWTWVVLDEPVQLREFRTTAEAITSYVGECCSNPVFTSTCPYLCNSTPTNITTLPAGIHYLGFEVFDWSAWSGIDVQYSVDGTTWQRLEPGKLYRDKPYWEKCSLDYCPETNVYKTDQGLVPATNVQRCAPQECNFAGDGVDCETDIQTACDLDADNNLIEGITRVVQSCTDGSSSISWFEKYGTSSQNDYEPISGLFDCVTRQEISLPEPPPPLCEDWEIIDVYQLLGTTGVNKRVYSVIDEQLNGTATNPRDVFNQPIDDTQMPGLDPKVRQNSLTSVEADLFLIDGINGRDAMQVWTWINVEEPIEIRENRSTAEAIDFYFGDCCSTPVLTASCDYSCSGASQTLPLTKLEPGIHFIGFEIFDWSAFAGLDIEYSTDGARWQRIPPDWLYRDKPYWEKCSLDYCPESGMYKTDRGLVPADNVRRCAPQTCTPPGGLGDNDGDGGGGSTVPRLPPCKKELISDNFQDGNGNAPFNLQVRNATINPVSWQALIEDVPYSTIPNLQPGNYTFTTSQSAGLYDYLFTGTQPLDPFQNITINGGAPSPPGVGGVSNVNLFCESL